MKCNYRYSPLITDAVKRKVKERLVPKTYILFYIIGNGLIPKYVTNYLNIKANFLTLEHWNKSI